MSSSATATGYSSEAYARSLGHLGDVVALPASGGWLLAAVVPGHDERDGRGPYPLFSCADWSPLADDLASLEDLVSVTMVVDPLAPLTRQHLERVFDVVRPYKTHHVIDCGLGPPRPSQHHLRKLRAVASDVRTEVVGSPPAHADDWVRLYRDLVRRRAITGFADLPDGSLRAQLDVPGCVAVRAVRHDRCLSMALWYRHGEVAHLHLAATDDEGYGTGAAYAVMAASIEHLASEVQVLDLGGVAGVADDPQHGLARFKRGWCNSTTVAHLCGAVLDRPAFDRLNDDRGQTDDTYFPPYRAVTA